MTVFQTVLAICYLKKNPSDLPYSYQWFAFFLCVNLFLYAFVGKFFPTPQLAYVFVAHLLLQMGLFWGVMRYYGYANRWLKSLMAVLSTRLCILLITFAVGILLQSAPSMLMFIFGVAAIWFLVVLGHIMRCTLDVPLSKGVLWAIAVDMLSNILVSAFFQDSLDWLGAN